jgi:hypothetical protein
MKKIIYALILLICLFGCNSNADQTTKEVDSIYLSKQPKIPFDETKYIFYSVAILNHNKSGQPGGGTGFFIKKNGRTFLVSNYHVFTSQNTAEIDKPFKRFDSMFILYRIKDKSENIRIDISKIQKESKPQYFFNKPDIYAYDVTDLIPKNENVLCVNDFIDENFKALAPSEIFAYGYPVKEKVELDLLKFAPSVFNYDTSRFHYPLSSKNITLVTMTNSYFVNGDSEHGMSGAPIFYVYTENGKPKIVFGGVLSTETGVKEFNLVVIVKPQEVIKLINEQP